MTNYEKYFGTPEILATYIVDNCPCACLDCAFPTEIPCYREIWALEDEDRQLILDWLKEENDNER